MIYLEVGETFEVKLPKLKVVESRGCQGCYCEHSKLLCDIYSCVDMERKDKTSIIFVEIKE